MIGNSLLNGFTIDVAVDRVRGDQQNPILALNAWLSYSPQAGTHGFVSLPPLYWLLLFGILVCNMLLTQVIKSWFMHRFGEG